MGIGVHRSRAVTALLIGLTVVIGVSKAAAAPKPKPPPAEPPAKPIPAALVPPEDANELSLRIAAMETVYELDLSDSQLAAIRPPPSAGVAQVKQRAAAKSTEKLTSALKDLYQALAAQDAEKIVALRGQVDTLLEDDAVDLDDAVAPTEPARAKAPAAMKLLKASQIAAYLVDHADEVADPVELMMDTLTEIIAPDAEEVDSEIADAAEQVSRLIAGGDNARAKQIAEQVTAWLKAGKAMKPDELPARQAELEASAKKIVGDISAIQVLSNWLEGELAELLSNPQLPAAIDATLAGRKQ
jgi:hypothetical protein